MTNLLDNLARVTVGDLLFGSISCVVIAALFLLPIFAFFLESLESTSTNVGQVLERIREARASGTLAELLGDAVRDSCKAIAGAYAFPFPPFISHTSEDHPYKWCAIVAVHFFGAYLYNTGEESLLGIATGVFLVIPWLLLNVCYWLGYLVPLYERNLPLGALCIAILVCDWYMTGAGFYDLLFLRGNSLSTIFRGIFLVFIGVWCHPGYVFPSDASRGVFGLVLLLRVVNVVYMVATESQ